MRKTTFILIFLISFLLLNSIVNAQLLKIPLDIISNFLNNILKALGITPTAVISEKTISSSGSIAYPDAIITIDSSNGISKNYLSLGFQPDQARWRYFIEGATAPVMRQYAQDMNAKLVRVFDFRNNSQYGNFPDLMPCLQWNSITNNCSYSNGKSAWNWTYIDLLVDAIYSFGAEPLFALGDDRQNKVDSSGRYIAGGLNNYPRGMRKDSTTGLPNATEYAAYAAGWVKHFKSTGKPVRFYDIINEPGSYILEYTADNPKIGYYVNFFNTVARAMRAENSNLLISQDYITFKVVFDYWLEHGDDVDFIDNHKYDGRADANNTADQELFRRTETYVFDDSTEYKFYGVINARQMWYNSRHKWLPIIIGETNIAWKPSFKVQQMSGAVWTALMLRASILKGVNYTIYWEWCNKLEGLGMIKEYSNPVIRWYPYYVHKMIGPNLAVDDSIVDSSSSSDNIRTLAWKNDTTLNILLIHKSTELNVKVRIQGIEGQLTSQTISDPTNTNYVNPTVQTGTFTAPGTITFNNYTVMLLQKPV